MTYTNPSFVERASDVFSVRHRKAPQTWGSAFRGRDAYPNQVTYTDRPFLGRGADGKQKTELGGSVF